ncbi:MAG: ABC transporter ATP-binding protein [Actinomycetota bacterium]
MLEAGGLSVSFGEIPAVRGLDLQVGRGEVLAILGRNGAGKTTTLRALAGIVRPSRGMVILNGEDVTHIPAERRVRKGIVLVPEGRRLFAGLSVRDNLCMGAYHRRLRPHAIAEEIERVTEHLPLLRERFGQRAGSLSGGEQQLLAIARALMTAPRLLLADEPSLGLAPIMVDRVYALFAALRDDGLTLVIVEQYVSVALGLADHAVVMDKGVAVLRSHGSELTESPDLIDAYLSGAQEVPA